MASGLGADFDRAQAAYDAMLPPEDRPIELECQRCRMLFEAGRASERYCPECLAELAKQDEDRL